MWLWHDGKLGVEESAGRPVQVLQSVIAIEAAANGALLWQTRFFESGDRARRASEHVPDSGPRLTLALALGVTCSGRCGRLRMRGAKRAALAVTVGLAISLIPILLRVLPPPAKDASTDKRDPDYVVTVMGLIRYVAGVLVLLDVE